MPTDKEQKARHDRARKNSHMYAMQAAASQAKKRANAGTAPVTLPKLSFMEKSDDGRED
jgi:hypothetical protein